MSSKESLLAEVQFFQLLDPEERASLAEVLEESYHEAGAVLFEFGDPGDCMYVVGSGAVEDILIQSRTFSSIQFALEYAVTLKLRLEVKRRDGTTVDLDDRVLQESDLYFASADIETMRKNREEAVRRVSMIIAGRLHDSLFERSIP